MARRGNPNWGNPGRMRLIPNKPTEFDFEIDRLGLSDERFWEFSKSLKSWVRQHRNFRYVPEWLLDRWGLEVSDEVGTLKDSIRGLRF
jgi:hypothetical protein